MTSCTIMTSFGDVIHE